MITHDRDLIGNDRRSRSDTPNSECGSTSIIEIIALLRLGFCIIIIKKPKLTLGIFKQ